MSYDFTTEGMLVVWSLFSLALLEIILIIYFTGKDIIKSSQNLFVLKDEYTVFFVTFLIIGLFFKLLVIDTYYKKEIENSRYCSMYVSNYLPQIFLVMGTFIFMLKTSLLQYIVKDNEQSYRQRLKKRRCYANILLRALQCFLFIMLLLRYLNTCYRKAVGRFLDFPTNYHFFIFELLKAAFIVRSVWTLFFITKNEQAQKFKKVLWAVIGCFIALALEEIIVGVLIYKAVIPTRFIEFQAIFYFDLALIILMALTVIVTRQIELSVLIQIGVYKNIDLMTDKEMFTEYEKLRKQSYKLKRKLRQRNKKRSLQNKADNRVSINDDQQVEQQQ